MLPPWRGKSYGCDCRTSEGVRPTKREELTLEQIKAASDLLMPNKSYMSSDAFGRVVMAVAAALAAQEARHKAETEKSEQREAEAWRQLEALRAEYARTTAVGEDDVWVFDVPGDDIACVAEYRIRWLRVKMRAEEAESNLREATEREKTLTNALQAALDCHTTDSDHCRFCEEDAAANRHASGCVVTSMRAAIRSGPAQQAVHPATYCQCGDPGRRGWHHFGRHHGLSCKPGDPPEQETPTPEPR